MSACVRQRGPGGGSRRGSRVRHRPAAARSPAAARCSAPLLQKTKSCPSVATLTRGRLCLAECRPRRDLLAPAPSLALASAQLVTSARPGHTCSTHHAVTWTRHNSVTLHTITSSTHIIMNLSVDSSIVDPQQQQPAQPHNRQNLNLLLLHQMYQPLVSGEFIKYFYTCTIL